jgi:DNA-binding PadR family transcriptional regulator
MFAAHAWAVHPGFWTMRGQGCHGPRGRRWWSEAMGDAPPRAERGEVRYLVLSAIANQPRHGYEIIQTIEERSRGQYRPSPGVIYPTLQMLEELGHVTVVESEGRKAYAITDAGRHDLEANEDAVRDFYDRFGDEPWEQYAEDFGEMMKRIGRLLRAFKRGSRGGHLSPEVMAKIREALDEALAKIERAFAPRG